LAEGFLKMGNIPLHPLVVHFPIALFMLGSLLLVLSYWKKDVFRKATYSVLGFGFVSGIIAYLSGDGGEEYGRKYLSGVNHAAVDKHETVAMLSMVTYGALLAVFIVRKFVPSKYWAVAEIALAAAGLVFIVLTGHYGGQMVYNGK
jgi:uncharacterized membrane protein